MRHVDEQPRIHVQADRDAVEGDGGNIAQRAVLRLLAGAHAGLFGVSRFHVRWRAQMNFACVAVDDDRVALLDDLGDVGNVAHGRNRQRAGDDRQMARGARLLEHKPAQTRPVVVEERGRTHRARNEDGAFRQLFGQQDEALTRELMQEPVGDVGQIMQPIAQIRIGLSLQLGARIVLNALDRGLGGEARTHRLPQTTQPAAVMRDHAERLEHVAVLARDPVVAPVDQRIDRGAHRADRRLQALQFRLDVVGHDLGHGHPRLVHDHVAEAEAVSDAETLERQRPPAGHRRTLRRDPLQLARGDHFGEKHRRRLKRFHLFFRVGAPRAILHHEHADRRAPRSTGTPRKD